MCFISGHQLMILEQLDFVNLFIQNLLLLRLEDLVLHINEAQYVLVNIPCSCKAWTVCQEIPSSFCPQ
jgi:hypothetical protein